MEKVKQLLSLGLPFAEAVRAALRAPDSVRSGQTLQVQEFALKHGLQRTALSAAINGQRAITPQMLDALVAELGGTVDEWRALQRQARLAAVHTAA